MRRCKQTKEPIPSFAKSETLWHKKGFSSLDAMVEYGNNAVKKAKERLQRKAQSESRKAMAEERRAYNAAKRARNDESLSHQKALTQKEFNRMIRLLDAGKECISCGKIECGFGWDAGHYRSVAACPSLRYDPRNVHLQGAGCNRTNHKANYKRRINTDTVNAGYQDGIVRRYGIDLLNWLDGPHEPKHYTCEDLKAMRAEFASECRRLERGEKQSRDWRKLDV